MSKRTKVDRRLGFQTEGPGNKLARREWRRCQEKEPRRTTRMEPADWNRTAARMRMRTRTQSVRRKNGVRSMRRWCDRQHWAAFGKGCELKASKGLGAAATMGSTSTPRQRLRLRLHRQRQHLPGPRSSLSCSTAGAWSSPTKRRGLRTHRLLRCVCVILHWHCSRYWHAWSVSLQMTPSPLQHWPHDLAARLIMPE